MTGHRKKKPRERTFTIPARREGKTLLEALAPFANVKLPSGKDGECVWFYVGKLLADDHGHLKLEDFRRARRAVG